MFMQHSWSIYTILCFLVSHLKCSIEHMVGMFEQKQTSNQALASASVPHKNMMDPGLECQLNIFITLWPIVVKIWRLRMYEHCTGLCF